jgi:hypothetical protein
VQLYEIFSLWGENSRELEAIFSSACCSYLGKHKEGGVTLDVDGELSRQVQLI